MVSVSILSSTEERRLTFDRIGDEIVDDARVKLLLSQVNDVLEEHIRLVEMVVEHWICLTELEVIDVVLLGWRLVANDKGEVSRRAMVISNSNNSPMAMRAMFKAANSQHRPLCFWLVMAEHEQIGSAVRVLRVYSRSCQSAIRKHPLLSWVVSLWLKTWMSATVTLRLVRLASGSCWL